jgi:hypothetical protein
MPDPYTTSTRECASMRLLARDGWTIGELRMTMHLSDYKSVRRHVLGECSHDHGVPPLADWDGQTPPAELTADARVGAAYTEVEADD